MPTAINPNSVNADPLNRTLSQRVRRNSPRMRAIDQVASMAPSAPASKPAARIGAKLIENDERSYSSKASNSEITTRPTIASETSSVGGRLINARASDTPRAGGTTTSSRNGSLSRERGHAFEGGAAVVGAT